MERAAHRSSTLSLQVPITLEAEGGQLVRAMQVQCGAMHTVVLVQNHGRLEVRAAGANSYGQLGLGNRTEQHRFHPIPALQVRCCCACACCGRLPALLLACLGPADCSHVSKLRAGGAPFSCACSGSAWCA